MTARHFLLVTFLAIANLTSGQNRVTIDDPELSFSYILPEGWLNYDDDFYHYMLNPDSTIQITLTYFDGMCADLDQCYEGEVEGKLRTEYGNFHILQEKQEEIAGTSGRWVHFTGSLDGTIMKATALYLIRHNQFFKIVAYMPPDGDASKEEAVMALLRTLETVPKP